MISIILYRTLAVNGSSLFSRQKIRAMHFWDNRQMGRNKKASDKSWIWKIIERNTQAYVPTPYREGMQLRRCRLKIFVWYSTTRSLKLYSKYPNIWSRSLGFGSSIRVFWDNLTFWNLKCFIPCVEINYLTRYMLGPTFSMKSSSKWGASFLMMFQENRFITQRCAGDQLVGNGLFFMWLSNLFIIPRSSNIWKVKASRKW